MTTKKFCIIGLGYFGSNLSKFLTTLGAEVLAIDKDYNKVEEISPYVTAAVQLDSTDKTALMSQGVSDFDAVIVAIGEGFESSITTTAILQEIGVKVIYNRIVSQLHQRLLSLMGITNLLVPEAEAAEHLARQLISPAMIDSFKISDKHSVFIIKVPDKFIGKSIIDSKIRTDYNLNVVTIKKGKLIENKTKDTLFAAPTIGVPLPTYIFEDEDILVLFGTEQDFENFSL